jgi:hypothetical protein
MGEQRDGVLRRHEEAHQLAIEPRRHIDADDIASRP